MKTDETNQREASDALARRKPPVQTPKHLLALMMGLTGGHAPPSYGCSMHAGHPTPSQTFRRANHMGRR
jgi:hypothetical protein